MRIIGSTLSRFKTAALTAGICLVGAASAQAMPVPPVTGLKVEQSAAVPAQYRDWDRERWERRRWEREREFRRWQRDRREERWDRQRRYREWERRSFY